MNSFGRIFRVHIFGESHGQSVGIVIDGCPAGLALAEDDLLPDLERRKGGRQKGTTPRQEADYPFFKSGLFNGKTTGAPITILFENNNTRSADYEKQRSFPRPGHADWVAHQKYGGNEDYRGGGHFSARLTTGLVAAGSIAKKLLNLAVKTSPQTPLQRRGAFEDSGKPGYFTTPADNYKFLKEFAKQNRKNRTEAEDKLWQQVRNRQIDGFKFRRQHPIAGFIPDFICLEKKLIIEIDGEYHNAQDQQQYDTARTEWLKEHNYFLLRFTNEEVLKQMPEVLQKISEALQHTKTNLKLSESPKAPLLWRGVGGEVSHSPSPLERELEGEVSHSPSPLERELEGEVTQQQNTYQSSESTKAPLPWRGVGGEVFITAAVTHINGESDLEKGLQNAIDAKDSVGGIVECRVTGLPVGLGEPFFDSVESQIAHIAFAIPAVKGIEFGSGFAAAKMFGSQHNDAIENIEGKTKTNHAGGIVGGITNGNELVFRIAIKPTASTPKQQNSLNWDTGKLEDFSIKGRHDLCVALRAPVIVEAATAIVLADLFLLEQRVKRVIS